MADDTNRSVQDTPPTFQQALLAARMPEPLMPAEYQARLAAFDIQQRQWLAAMVKHEPAAGEFTH